ncbi:hypothetical protein ACRALDRAFT_1059571 [Sodiomyces alcalophilus JCM 7366]|uniref:uncharacterized protein n=1 Tax=Sodiomyces alcalophilus JCM 7366 TaxID=591952 RepID=UPI0039B54AEB
MEYVNRAATNLRATFEDLTLLKVIRLVIIVGAYALLRPYIMKFGSKLQTRGHEAGEEQEEPAAPRARLTPNDIRGQAAIPEDSDDDEEEAEGPAAVANWGKKARRRQRHVLKKLLDAEERRLAELQEDEEDKDIEEFLDKD